MDEQEIRHREKAIQDGVNDFLDDHELDLSNQNMERIARHLFKFFEEERSISATAINDYLSRIFEYNELNIEAMNDKSGSSSEDLLVSLVLSAENKHQSAAKKWWLIIIIISLLVTAVIYLQPSSHTEPITVAQSEKLKSLVSKIVEVEQSKNNNTSHIAVWNTIKDLEAIIREGQKSSYKDFSQGQYETAKEYLEQWINKAQKEPASTNETNLISLAAENIRVIDGDTFEADNQRYRLWGIDAFELKQKCFDQNKMLYSCGINSKKELEKIFSAAKDIKCHITTKDRYKRSIVKCMIDDVPLGTLLAASGWAVDYERYSGGEFKEDEKQAQSSKSGAWNGCFVKPWDYRHKENLNTCD